MRKKKAKKSSVRLSLDEEDDAGLYFDNPDTKTFSTGCTLLDCVLGGGWAYRRIANIVGDKSTGKTLLAIEACANFAKENPDGKIYYVETEAAFDEGYAEALGLPLDQVEFPEEEMFEVESIFEHLEKILEIGADRPILYIIDSLDAVSDRAEQKRKVDDGTYGMTKQKKLSELFRRLNARLSKANVTIMIVSQIRDKIGVAFGEKHSRSGGKALDFYATHVLWLAHLQQIKKTRKGVSRPVGVKVKAKCKKNKVSMPFRECEFPLYFAYGVEDVEAGVSWLLEVKRTDAIGLTQEKAKRFPTELAKLTDKQYQKERKNVSEAVKEVWADIEEAFRPKRRKY